MVKLPQQFVEDRALRDAARSVLIADIAHARNSLSGKGIATRVTSRIADGAKDVFEVAKVQAEDNRGILAILIGALVLWLAREPLLEALGNGQEQDNLDAAPLEEDPEQPRAETEADPAAGDNHE